MQRPDLLSWCRSPPKVSEAPARGRAGPPPRPANPGRPDTAPGSPRAPAPLKQLVKVFPGEFHTISSLCRWPARSRSALHARRHSRGTHDARRRIPAPRQHPRYAGIRRRTGRKVHGLSARAPLLRGDYTPLPRPFQAACTSREAQEGRNSTHAPPPGAMQPPNEPGFLRFPRNSSRHPYTYSARGSQGKKEKSFSKTSRTRARKRYLTSAFQRSSREVASKALPVPSGPES